MQSVVQKVVPLAVGSSIALGGFAVANSQPIMLEGEAPREKLPIYPLAQPEVILVKEDSALTSHIASGREVTQGVITDVREATQRGVAKVVAAERNVVTKVDSLIPKDEELTPGLLYVLVATLTGSIIARNRFIGTRLLLPPAIFLTALPTFNPKLAHNLSEEVSYQTKRVSPELHAQASELRSNILESTEQTRSYFRSSKDSLGKHLGQGVQVLEDKSGLQLAQAWKNRSVPHSAEPVVVSRASTRDVTVPIFGEHAERQVIPGTNTVVSHTAPNSRPTEVLSVPVYKQVGGPVSVQERADAAATRGLDKLERKAEPVLDAAKARAAEAKHLAEEKLAQGKQAAIDAGHLAERKAADAAEATKRGAAEAKQYAQDKAQQGKDAAIHAEHVAERKAREAVDATKRGAADAKSYAQDKVQEGREAAVAAERAAERKFEEGKQAAARAGRQVESKAEEVKERATSPYAVRDNRLKVDEVPVTDDLKTVEVRPATGYKKLV